jgi:hypothetical protein
MTGLNRFTFLKMFALCTYFNVLFDCFLYKLVFFVKFQSLSCIIPAEFMILTNCWQLCLFLCLVSPFVLSLKRLTRLWRFLEFDASTKMLGEFKFGPYQSSTSPRLPLPRIGIRPCSQKPVLFKSCSMAFQQVVTEINDIFSALSQNFENWLPLSLRLSVRPRGTTRLPLDGF